MTAITAITAQNTVGVEAVEAVSPETIVAQVRAVAEDIGVDAVKIGMLGTAETVDAVVEALGSRRRGAGGRRPGDGRRERRGAARRRTRARRWSSGCCRWPRSSTPNIPEARALTGAGRGGDPGGAGARGAGARAARRWSSPAATASAIVDLFFDGARVGRDPRRAPPRRRRARLRLHPLLGAGGLPRPRRGRRWRRRARRARSPPRRSAHGLREIGAGPGPGRRLGSMRLLAAAIGARLAAQ